MLFPNSYKNLESCFEEKYKNENETKKQKTIKNLSKQNPDENRLFYRFWFYEIHNLVLFGYYHFVY